MKVINRYSFEKRNVSLKKRVLGPTISKLGFKIQATPLHDIANLTKNYINLLMVWGLAKFKMKGILQAPFFLALPNLNHFTHSNKLFTNSFG